MALHRQYHEAQKFHMLGFQFLATVCARLAGAKDVDFMPDSEPPKLLPLDATENYFRALAEASKANGTT